MNNNIKKVLIGLFSGVISGLFGAGGGLLLVPAYSYFFHESEKVTKATVIFCILPMVLTSSLFYFSDITSYLSTILKCWVGEIVGSFIGSKLLNTLHPKYIKIIFILFLLYSSIRIIFY